MIDDLVSIITPVYNSSEFIKQTIESVQKQTYTSWEMIIVDDCSTDETPDIIKEILQRDGRIIYIKLEKNSGAAVARNRALGQSKGRFIAYLDADDLWEKHKLQNQMNYMLVYNYAFTCSDYKKIDINGRLLRGVKMPSVVNYERYLRNTIIQTVGVMIDTKKVDKELLIMPNIRRRQDAATWCQLLKAGFICYRIPEFLAYYRSVPSSLSSNKIKAVKGTWYLYRRIEKLSIPKACFCFLGYIINAARKRIYIKTRDNIMCEVVK